MIQSRSAGISKGIGIALLPALVAAAILGGYILTTRNIEPTVQGASEEGMLNQGGEPIDRPVIPREPEEFRVLAVSKLEFRPDIIQIRVGDSVLWENPDSEAHTVTAGNFTANGELFFNELLEPEETFRITFTEPGTYFYSCAIKFHGMHGIIRVQE